MMLAEAYCDPWLKLKLIQDRRYAWPKVFLKDQMVSKKNGKKLPEKRLQDRLKDQMGSKENGKKFPEKRLQDRLKLPEGSEVTLAELREIAARQQQQIEAQQQLLVAKEQRLKFLKQQEARHHQGAQTTEGERLRPLRDKVETQELKLRRLRALRGQAEQQRASNHNLTAELDSIRALFNEKEKELSLAVAKVEELTRQLEELRRGNVNGLISESVNGISNSPSVVELEKLRRELLYRTKLNEQQNARILQQRETLAKRQEEISLMDQRIASLQQRLHRKRTLNQQIASHIHAATLAKQAQIHPISSNNNNSNLVDNQGKSTAASRLIRPLNTNIAAVEPLKRVPQENEIGLEEVTAVLKGEEEDDLSEFALNKKDPKYQTLPYNTKFSVKSNREGSGEDTVDKSQLISDSETLASVKTNDEHQDSPSSTTSFHQFSPQKQPPPSNNFTNGSIQPLFSKIPSPHTHNLSNLAPRPFGSSYGGSLVSSVISNKGQIQTNQGGGNQNINVPNSVANAQSINSPVLSTSSMVTSPVMGKHPVLSSQMSNGVVPRSKLPTATGIPVLPATALTSALKKPGNHQSPAYKDIPPYTAPPPVNIRSNNSPVTPQSSQSNSMESSNTSASSTTSSKTMSNQNDNSDSLDSPSDSTSSDNSGDKSKPALPPKPSIPVKPVPPPRQTHILGVAGASNGPTKKSDVDSALLVLKGTGNRSRSGNGYRYVMKPTHNFPSRLPLGPSTMDQYAKAMNHVYRNEMQQLSSSSDNQSQENDSGIGSGETNENEGNRKLGSSQLPIQPRPLTIKKPSGLDPPRLRSTFSGSGLSQIKRQNEVTSPTGQLMSPTAIANRRIEMPPAFLFPENQNSGENNNQNKSSLGERLDADGDVTLERCNGQLPLSPIRNKSGMKFIKESAAELTVKEEIINGNQDSERVSEGLHSNSEQGTEDENDSEHRKHLSETSQEDVETDESQVSGSISNKSSHLTGNSAVFRRVKKGNLKTKGSAKNPRRVSFDPLALLLDASLEGELELVRKTAKEVPNPSAANDEGITALHNAICAGHLEIVKFLVEFGCDVNAQDSDGWTPLHCAASCNNLPMVKFLVEHGACIFATTLSDHETAAEKCEEDEEGFDGCSEYLYSVQEKLGILNTGAVYGVYDYEAQNPDELSFKDGEMLIVLRKGDDLEREWWWSKLRDREGYIPRNLLGLQARVTARRDP